MAALLKCTILSSKNVSTLIFYFCIVVFSDNINFSNRNFENYLYLARRVYVNQLRRWFKIFPKDQFLIFDTKNFNIQIE